MQGKDAGVTAWRGRYEQMEFDAGFQPESSKEIFFKISDAHPSAPRLGKVDLNYELRGPYWDIFGFVYVHFAMQNVHKQAENSAMWPLTLRVFQYLILRPSN